MWRRTDRMIPIHLPKTVCVGVINCLPIALFVPVFVYLFVSWTNI